MNIRQSRLIKLILSGVLALSALLGAGSAMAGYSGTWQSVAIENQSFNYAPGDFVRFGVTDIPNCGNSSCLGRWSYKGFTGYGTATCSNNYWQGDPYPNHVKNCEKLVSLPGAGHGAPVSYLKYVAVEGGTVYGNNSGCSQGASECNLLFYIAWESFGTAYDAAIFVSGPAAITACNNATFGDPRPGVQKHCFFSK